MVFMNAKKRNKTVTYFIVGFLSVGLLLSVSLYWTGSGSVSNSSGISGSSADGSVLQNFQDAMTSMQSGKTEEANKKFDLAIKGFETVVKNNPKDFQSYGDLATAYFYRNNADKAIENVKKALEISPGFSTARLNYAIYLFYGKNQLDLALAELAKIKAGDVNYQKAQQLKDSLTQEAKKTAIAPPAQGTTSTQPGGSASTQTDGATSTEEANPVVKQNNESTSQQDLNNVFPGGTDSTLNKAHPGQ